MPKSTKSKEFNFSSLILFFIVISLNSELTLFCDEILSLGAGDFNFVLTAYRNGYSEPQAVNNAMIHMYEIII